MTDERSPIEETHEFGPVELGQDSGELDATAEELEIVLPIGMQLGLSQLIDVPAEASLVARLAWVQGQIDYVAKDGKPSDGGGVGYQFRTIDGVMGALHNPLARAGVVITPTIKKHTKEPYLGYLLTRTQTVPADQDPYLLNPNSLTTLHIDYTFRCTTTEGERTLTISAIGEGIDNSDKGIGKAYSYAFKAIMAQVFTIPSADPGLDNESVQHPQESMEAAPEPWWPALGWLSEKHHADTRKQLFDAARALEGDANTAMKTWMGSYECAGAGTITARPLWDGKTVAPFLSITDAQAWNDQLESPEPIPEPEPEPETAPEADSAAPEPGSVDVTDELVAAAADHATKELIPTDSEIREAILSYLDGKPSTPRTIASGIGATTVQVSKALSSLRNDKLVTLQRIGRNETYSLSPAKG